MLAIGKALTFDDVLLVPGYNGITSRQDVDTSIQVGGKTFASPIVSSNMDTVTEDGMANFIRSVGGLPILHRFMTIERNVEVFQKVEDKKNTAFSVGVGKDGMERAEALVAAGAEIVCVDVAHGHSKQVNQMIRRLKEAFGKDHLLIIAGNVATYAGADYLAAAGADLIKVGIGSGSVCTTRIKTGFGVPQLSAIWDCAKVDRKIIADGGIRHPGDMVKALAAGADMVMLGSVLAGTDETPGDFIERSGSDGTKRRFKIYRGMASQEAQEAYMGQMSDWKTAEGVSCEIPAKGSAQAILRDMLGGLRSGLTYCGADNIDAMHRKASFIEISDAGKEENQAHAIKRYS